ncbi:MAG TPA: YkuS family protein [Desulfotomaculum sp.]|nr:YkuS family protein [Desulfotomaculum sp.]
MPKVAVDEGLSSMKAILRQEGFEVVHPEDAAGAVALVTDGAQKNMLNIQDVTFNGPVIDARGKSPAEVLDAVKASLRKR